MKRKKNSEDFETIKKWYPNFARDNNEDVIVDYTFSIKEGDAIDIKAHSSIDNAATEAENIEFHGALILKNNPYSLITLTSTSE